VDKGNGSGEWVKGMGSVQGLDNSLSSVLQPGPAFGPLLAPVAHPKVLGGCLAANRGPRLAAPPCDSVLTMGAGTASSPHRSVRVLVRLVIAIPRVRTTNPKSQNNSDSHSLEPLRC